MSASAAKLYIMSGLPGVGKSTLAQVLAGRVGGFYLRIDTIEQKLRHFGVEVQSEGYVLSYAIAEENLRIGTERDS
jgi:predicted kinase